MYYSIDKLKIIIYGIKIEVVNLILKKLSCIIDKDLIYYESKAIVKCYHNFSYNGIYLGIENNLNKKFEKYYKNVVIEFNPNKTKLSSFPINLQILFEDIRKIEVMCVDVAVDVEVPIQNLLILKRHENQRLNILCHASVETYYLGGFNENGFCRIYDKAKESKLNYPLTRIEMHIKKLGFFGYFDQQIAELNTPNIYIIKNDLEISATNKVLILACYQMPYLLSMLEKRRKNQIKELIRSNLEKVEIDKESINKICYNIREIFYE